MIYGVTVYHKSGKIKKRIKAKQLSKKHWTDFQIREKASKRFIKEKMTAGTHKLLREYQNMNSLLDGVLFNPIKNRE